MIFIFGTPCAKWLSNSDNNAPNIEGGTSMKRRLPIFIPLAFIAVLAIASTSYAWGGGKGGCPAVQNPLAQLSEEQQKEFQTLSSAYHEEVRPLRANLMAKHAEYQAALVQDKVDGKAVDKLIKEIAVLESDLTVKRLSFRAQLVEKFDMPAGYSFHGGMGRGAHGYGPCGFQGKGYKGNGGQAPCPAGGPCARQTTTQS